MLKIKDRLLNKIKKSQDQKQKIQKALENRRKIRETKAEISCLTQGFDYAVSKELIDYYVYRLRSAQLRLDYYIKLAGKEDIND